MRKYLLSISGLPDIRPDIQKPEIHFFNNRHPAGYRILNWISGPSLILIFLQFSDTMGLSKCCCGCSLHTGCLIIGILQLIFQVAIENTAYQWPKLIVPYASYTNLVVEREYNNWLKMYHSKEITFRIQFFIPKWPI